MRSINMPSRLRGLRGASAREAERAANALVARDPALERTRSGPLPELPPIPASWGVADLPAEQPTGEV